MNLHNRIVVEAFNTTLDMMPKGKGVVIVKDEKSNFRLGYIMHDLKDEQTMVVSYHPYLDSDCLIPRVHTQVWDTRGKQIYPLVVKSTQLLDFKSAFELLKSGRRVARRAWEPQWVVIEDWNISGLALPTLIIHHPTERYFNGLYKDRYNPSVQDIEAHDWYELPKF